jgi:circadian clock protein KaiC
VQTALPEALGADGHLIRALGVIDSFKPDHLIVDAISACVRMGSEQAAFDYLMRLVSVVKERGITCILTNQINGLIGTDEELSGIGFSSVVDAVIQLRFIETDQAIVRQILVVKSRGAAHSNRRHPFLITDDGIQFPADPQSPPGGAGQAGRKEGGQ